jgi:hypothetical protein
VNYANISVLVPPSWRVHDITGQIYPCFGEPPRTVRIGTTNRLTLGCNPSLAASPLSSLLGNYLVILGDSVPPDDARSTTINRRVPRTGPGGVELTLGRDGRIDAAILNSLHYTPPR